MNNEVRNVGLEETKLSTEYIAFKITPLIKKHKKLAELFEELDQIGEPGITWPVLETLVKYHDESEDKFLDEVNRLHPMLRPDQYPDDKISLEKNISLKKSAEYMKSFYNTEINVKAIHNLINTNEEYKELYFFYNEHLPHLVDELEVETSFVALKNPSLLHEYGTIVKRANFHECEPEELKRFFE
ncbi:MAG TPA: hypothetical protein VFH18_04535 [Erysipelotrichaceae bacterium]|nr:hypothetical protein [Erysipelotrichaceae bacterium]